MGNVILWNRMFVFPIFFLLGFKWYYGLSKNISNKKEHSEFEFAFAFGYEFSRDPIALSDTKRVDLFLEVYLLQEGFRAQNLKYKPIINSDHRFIFGSKAFY